MASHDTEGAGAFTVPHLAITTPEKTARSTVSASSTLSPSGEKSFELYRESAVSTPRSYNASNPFDTDVEAMMPMTTQDTNGRKSCTAGKADCSVWPGQDHWKNKAKAAKMSNRSCTCMARLSKRTRIIVKILIGLLIVGIAVGVGFGVSKPLGAPIWGNTDD